MLRFVLLLWICLPTSAGWAADRPNVVLIVTDDQGYGDMSCHKNPWVRTPNLDRLAAEGVRLEDYHVDPVCTPTRAALMTGRYSSRVGAWAVTEGRQLLNLDEVTMAQVFADSGYRTGMFGKWHLGDAWPFAPRFRGFQDVVRHLAGGIDEISNPIGNDYFDDTYYRDGQRETIDGYCTDVFFSECRRFMATESDKPFFAYLPLNAMHSPHDVADKYADPFRDAGHSEKRAKFFGQIVNFDENLGRLFDFLKQHSLENNTIVIFMGDNGSATGPADALGDFNAGMREKKGSVYEGGHRVACFVKWPAKLEAGRKVKQLTSCRDWLPTLIEWCGLNAPENVAFDGKNLTPLLEGRDVDWPDRTLFVERQSDQPSLTRKKDAYPQYAVMTERWRLVNGELYNIQADPGQTEDIALTNKDLVNELRKRYEAYFKDVFSPNAAYTRFQIDATKEDPMMLTVRDWHPTAGDVIWKQAQLADDSLQINGFWAINVVRAGRYSIRLTRFPDDAPQPIRASSATLRLGDQEFEKEVGENASSVSFEVELAEGPALLQTWLRDDVSGVRGAYFVEVQQLTR